MGISTVVLRLAPDGGEATDVPLIFEACKNGTDRYAVTLDTADLCQGASDGLFFYEFLFLRGFDTLFSDSINNVDFRLSERSGERFRLLVYAADYRTPAWFRGGIMYHVFLDRFCRGAGPVAWRAGAKEDSDWQNGTPQYASRAGAPVANNVFFGGNLWGVIEQLDYLQSLGVTVLYLSPVFKAASNHRYDTADYETVDALLGGDAALDALIEAAHARRMRVILDGVFNHTGDDSRYFNRRGTYPETGAYQSPSSPYADWFSFRTYPDDYEAWWGIEIMPRLQQANPACRAYFTGRGGIAECWLLRGADGWRLDVADELPDVFLDELRTVAKEATQGEALLLGEVWENAVDKIAYGARRRYFRGGQLDSVMNYPFRNAVIALILEGDTAFFYDTLTALYGTYPKFVSDSLMNLLGTHDTERILTVLGDEGAGEGLENPELAVLHLTPAQRATAVQRLKLAATLQFTVFGVPSVYYGDEAGVEGYHDPFCRRPFPWGREDAELLAHYRTLGRIRRENTVFGEGDFRFTLCEQDLIAYTRTGSNGEEILVAANVGREPRMLSFEGERLELLSNTVVRSAVSIPPMSAVLLKKQ